MPKKPWSQQQSQISSYSVVTIEAIADKRLLRAILMPIYKRVLLNFYHYPLQQTPQ